MYIFMLRCVCVCVRALDDFKEREREREKKNRPSKVMGNHSYLVSCAKPQMLGWRLFMYVDVDSIYICICISIYDLRVTTYLPS